MKRLEIDLEPELDRELGRVAEEHAVSKEELVRNYLRSHLELMPPLEIDPVVELFGTFRGAYPWDSERHDDVIGGDDG